jgi:hypothetical protein
VIVEDLKVGNFLKADFYKSWYQHSKLTKYSSVMEKLMTQYG